MKQIFSFFVFKVNHPGGSHFSKTGDSFLLNLIISVSVSVILLFVHKNVKLFAMKNQKTKSKNKRFLRIGIWFTPSGYGRGQDNSGRLC